MKKFVAHLLLCFVIVLAATSCATADTIPGNDVMPTDEQAALSSHAEGEVPEKWSDRASEVLMNALSLSGIRYQYGGNTPDSGFDCSGFVRYVFKQATSLTLPRSAIAMSQLGKTVRKNELQPGDLVFFNTLKSAFSHVGIYVGNNRFIHSPRSGGVVRVESLETEYWSKRFDGAKRMDADKEAANTKATD
jgi:cell wall-associated NlpC family hydrolase